MEKAERELIQKAVIINPVIKKLYARHQKLEKEVEHIRHYAKYSPTASLKHVELKREKLRGKEQMLAILQEINTLSI
jgi:uncharacterized protein YdcH (DUF465 family)